MIQVQPGSILKLERTEGIGGCAKNSHPGLEVCRRFERHARTRSRGKSQRFAGFRLQINVAQFDFPIRALGKRLVIQNGFHHVVVRSGANLHRRRPARDDDVSVKLKFCGTNGEYNRVSHIVTSAECLLCSSRAKTLMPRLELRPAQGHWPRTPPAPNCSNRSWYRAQSPAR